MLFNSIPFLIFFPVVAILYYVLPHRIRWIWLLMASYFFYMSWNAKFALLLAITTLITYLSGILIERSSKIQEQRKRNFQRKLWVALSFSTNLAILVFFKYFDFAISNINVLLTELGVTVLNPSFDILLPVGISFYTFKALSYTMDVYRGNVPVERNPAKYALYVSFFTQLVAGPIERSGNVLSQLNERRDFNYDRVKNGLLLMLWGFFQKLVIADRVAILVNQVFDHYPQYAGFQIGVAAVLFAFQIYCDFSGYSDIAIGASQVMGFEVKDNFRQPYFATSIQDFWRRWHISLSTWFRDYLYIPLGGSRCSRVRKYANLMITFLASGLWHGASWSFVVWGGLHGGFQIVGDILKPFKEKLYTKLKIRTEAFSFRLGRILATFILVDFAWIFFRAPGGKEALEMIQSMLGTYNPWILFDGSLFKMGLDQMDFQLGILAIVILMVGNWMQNTWAKKDGLSVRDRLAQQNLVFRWAFYLVSIFIVLVYGIYGPAYDASQFIYARF